MTEQDETDPEHETGSAESVDNGSEPPSPNQPGSEPLVEPLTSVPRKVWLTIAGGLCLMAAVVIGVVFMESLVGRDPDTTVSAQPTISNTQRATDRVKESVSGAVESPGESQVDAYQLQQEAIQQARFDRLKTEGKKLREEWVKLQESEHKFRLSLQSLLDDEQGKRIASSERLIDQYVAIRDRARPSQSEITEVGEHLDVLLEPLDGISAVSLSSGLTEEIDLVAKDLRQKARLFEQEHRLLSSLVSASSSQEASQESLQAVLERLANTRAQERLDAIAAATQRARDQAVKEEADRAREAIELQAAEDAAAAQAKREYEKLRREALSPQVLSLLAPMTTPDFKQPKNVVAASVSVVDTVSTPKSQPISFARLQSLGVLDTDERGMKKLAVLNSEKDWTRRPRWGITEYNAPNPALWTQQQHVMVRKAQEYLRKYGAVLVKEGKLAP